MGNREEIRGNLNCFIVLMVMCIFQVRQINMSSIERASKTGNCIFVMFRPNLLVIKSTEYQNILMIQQFSTIFHNLFDFG